MQHDEMIWQVVNHQFCSFKTTIGKALSDKTHFCRNPYSVTGLCNRTSCPLANSKYATIREENGRIYLFVKTIERAHSPKNLWEKILLSRNYGKAIAQLDEHLAYFPKVLMHRNKQRLTKIYQYLLRMRKIELKHRAGKKANLVGIHRKIDQREERRERKALIAAKIEKNIEKELLERLAKGTYGDIYNFPEMPYQKALDTVANDIEDFEDEEETTSATATIENDDDDEEEDEISDDGEMVEYVEDLEESDDEEEEDFEDIEYDGSATWDDENDDDDDDDDSSSDDDDDDNETTDDDQKKRKSKSNQKKKPPSTKPIPRSSRQPRVEIEYEEELEDSSVQNVAATIIRGDVDASNW
jgi:protein MAK16